MMIFSIHQQWTRQFQRSLIIVICVFSLVNLIPWTFFFPFTFSSSPYIRSVSLSKNQDAHLIKKLNDESHYHELASELSRIGSVYSQEHGIVLPLYDKIAVLGISLLMELETLLQNDTISIEIPHCGDLDTSFQTKLEQLNIRHQIYVYDVCDRAYKSTFSTGEQDNISIPLFCRTREHCNAKFRSFYIKIIAVLFSRYKQVMLLDADTLFFQSPAILWNTFKYQSTGTLFFRDRISYDQSYLARRVGDYNSISELHQFLTDFEVAPFKHLEFIPRNVTNLKNISRFQFNFEPSFSLLSSHAWNLRSGHHIDSSLVLWNKKKQPRATALLSSFVAEPFYRRYKLPSYGDKEYFFIACELAETDYALSDFATGAIGEHSNKREKALCGSALHFLPELNLQLSTQSTLLYTNSDLLETATPETWVRTRIQDSGVYNGNPISRKLHPECILYDSSGVTPLQETEIQQLYQRQMFYQKAKKILGS